MKNKLIIAFTFLSFCTLTTYAQDSTVTTSNKMKFGEFLTKTPWLVGIGGQLVDNDVLPNLFDIKLNSNTTGNLYRSTFFLVRATFDKALYPYLNKEYAKNLSLQIAISDYGVKPFFWLSLDGNLKYDLNALIGETKWFDPYALIGGGITKNSTGLIKHNGLKSDMFLTVNFGFGSNLWINDVVAFNLDAQGKIPLAFGGSKYVQYSAGLVFNVGGRVKSSDKAIEVVEVVKPKSTYQRTQDEEDALIHIRKHLQE
jgi:hypothetical protein